MMNSLLPFLLEDPFVRIALPIIFLISLILAISIIFIAFLQGREISAWPPKISGGRDMIGDIGRRGFVFTFVGTLSGTLLGWLAGLNQKIE